MCARGNPTALTCDTTLPHSSPMTLAPSPPARVKSSMSNVCIVCACACLYSLSSYLLDGVASARCVSSWCVCVSVYVFRMHSARACGTFRNAIIISGILCVCVCALVCVFTVSVCTEIPSWISFVMLVAPVPASKRTQSTRLHFVYAILRAHCMFTQPPQCHQRTHAPTIIPPRVAVPREHARAGGSRTPKSVY